jgi:phage terminase large subunit-like protein
MGASTVALGFAAVAIQYAEDVRDGRTLASKWTRKAAERFLADLDRQDWPYYFEPRKVEKVCRFFETLPHIKGKWATPTIKLEPWQVFILANVYGWLRKSDDARRFRTAYLEVPRKNTKSTILSGASLYAVTLDNEQGAEVYSAATTRDQAKIVFSIAKEMARRSPLLKGRINVGAHNLHVLETASKLEPLSSDARTLDGLNVHFAAVDELHAHRTREVWDVIETATGSRTQPLVWAITTAGSDRSGICYEQRTYVTKILDGVIEDETYFGIIYTIDDDDDPFDPATWAKANPNLGVSVFEDDLARKARKAREMPAALNNFLTKHLDVWVNSDVAWMDMRLWDKAADPSLTLSDFEGEECYIGIDLASEIDIAAVVLLFKRDGVYYPFLRSYLPEETAERSGNSQYSGWARRGRLILTPGSVTDFGYIEDDILDFAERFHVTQCGFDPFQATYLATRLQERGIPMVKVGATVLNFSEPMKRVEALVRSGKIKHDADPVLTWMMSNVVAHLDRKDNIYPRKERPENKIDGVVALLIAMNLALQEESSGSVYTSRGILSL